MSDIDQAPNSIRTETERALKDDGGNSGYLPRAFRYPIQMLIRFRKSGAADWHEGTTVNISRTGILFHSHIDLTPRTLLEMQITLPHMAPGEPQANVLCWGPVIRVDMNAAKEGQPALAAAISRYRFGHD